MSAYTPGPWRVEHNTQHGASVRGIHGITVAWCGTASAWATDGSHTIRQDEARANARLVAAAPEMLAALRAVMDGNMFDAPLVRCLVLGAIQKADGPGK